MKFVVVYESFDRRRCAEMRLVLVAAGIVCELAASDGSWKLLVEENNLQNAKAELEGYVQEQSAQKLAVQASGVAQPAGTMEGIFGYTAVLILCASFSWSASVGQQVEEIGIADAGAILDGQWWRTVTALTLHSDQVHLLSNLLFGAIFGFLAGQMLGGGIAWLLILAGGVSGNFANALLRDAAHLSLGASTAVFAALGLAVAYALRPSLNASQNTMQRWSPLIAGVLLLSFLGTGGERTDVGAHVTGFLSGLVCGWLSSHLPTNWLCNTKLQWAAGALTVGAVALAWSVGMAWGS